MHHPAGDSSANAEAQKRLTAELAVFLERWRHALARQAVPTDPAVIALQQQAGQLQMQASQLGLAEVTQHLARCQRAVEQRNFDELTQSLNALTGLQQRGRAEPNQAQSGERFRAGAAPPPSGGLAPPPMLTSSPPQAALQPPAADSMETLLSARDAGSPRPGMSQAPVPPPALLGALAHRQAASSPGVAPPPVAPPMNLAGGGPLQAAPVPVVRPPQVLAGSAPQATASKPMLQVRNMFALGRNKRSAPAAAAAVASAGPSGASPLLGLKSRKQSEPMSAVPPPLLPNDPMGLPRLSPELARQPAPMPRAEGAPAEVNQLLKQVSKERKRARPSAALPRPRARTPSRPSSGSGTVWIVLGASTLAVGVLVMVGVLVFKRPDPQPIEPLSSVAATASTSAEQELPRSKLSSSTEQLKSLVTQVHGRKLSPELRAYVDEDAALVAKALTKDCKQPNAPELCKELTEFFVDKKPLQIKKRQRDPNRPVAGWLRGLKMPTIPVEDDPRVLRQFEFYTQNPVGRETFQSMLFRCGAYRDLIQSTLVKYELPVDVMAVVLAESSCFAQAKSPAGAVGLWQFIPAAARAYHLRVREDVVDERLSPFKSTQAGVRYMADMFALFGEWDLVFASYNMGPFGLMARLERAGGDVGYWDLVDANLLPEETENYAPAIQALALILNNLSRLRFSTSQMKAPQLTADLEAPAGTRLGMVARAAAMSAVDLRRLNLDIVGDSVPNLPGGFSVQVPKDVVWQARDTLKELLAQGDDADMCVSPAFDWGKRQFTTEMAEACHRKLSSGAPGNVAGPEAPAPEAGPGPGAAPAPAPVRSAPRPRSPGPAAPAPPAGAAPAAPAPATPRLPTADDPPGEFELPEY